MKGAGWFALGALAGLALAFNLKRANDSSCCARVSAGAREKAGSACGPLSSLCTGLGDVFNLWGHAPDILDFLGVPP